MLPALIAGAELIKLVPSLFKLFGDENPPQIVEKVVDIAQSLTGESTPEAAVEKIKQDPELLLRYKDVAEKRAAEMIKLYLEDMQNARQRDTEIQKIKGSNVRANAMVALAVVTVILCLVVVSWLTDLDDFAKATITLICGRALGWVEQVFSFEFGTTRQSKAKDDTISKLSEKE